MKLSQFDQVLNVLKELYNKNHVVVTLDDMKQGMQEFTKKWKTQTPDASLAMYLSQYPHFIKKENDSGYIPMTEQNRDKINSYHENAEFKKKILQYYSEFKKKYSPAALMKLEGVDLLNRLCLGTGNRDNLQYMLEKDDNFTECFGKATPGNSNRYLLYKNGGVKWVKSESGVGNTTITEAEAIKIAKQMVEDFQKICDMIDNLQKTHDKFPYDKLSETFGGLKLSILKDTTLKMIWFRKYLHLMYPDLFPTFYNENLVANVTRYLGDTVSGDLWINIGKVITIAKEYKLSPAEFCKVVGDNFDMETSTADIKSKKKNADSLNTQNNHTKDGNMSQDSTDEPLNQILYGAPGTGKTYNSAIKALEIITGKTYELSKNLDEREKQYEKYLEEFNDYRKKGQIELVTFHQSMGYEDFVEGIKPVVDKQQTDLKYRVENGIFKNMVESAKGQNDAQAHLSSGNKIDFTKTRIFKMSLGKGVNNSEFDYCMNNDVITNGYGSGIDFSGVKTRQDIIDKLNNGKPNDFTISAMERFILWMQKGDIVLISDGISSVVAIAQVEGDYEYIPDTEIEYTHFRKVKWLYKGNIPITAMYDKKLSQQSIYGFFDINKYGTQYFNTKINTDYINDLIFENNRDRKYVLIIDEINRGNISKIFGELITLLEPSKRGTLCVKLPYSNDDFWIPKNLYVIGTMNTSDRSIAAVDIALRR